MQPFSFSGEGDLECPRWGPWEVRNTGALGQPWIQVWPYCVRMRSGRQCLPRRWGQHGPGKTPGRVPLVPGSTSSGSATGMLTPGRCGETVREWGLPLSQRFQPTEQESWRHRALWREMRLRWGRVLEESQEGGLGDALGRMGLVWVAQLDLGHEPLMEQRLGHLARAECIVLLGMHTPKLWDHPRVMTGTTTPGLYPPIPWTTLHAPFVIQEPLSAHLVPPFTFTGGEIEVQRGIETCPMPHSKQATADPGGNWAWASRLPSAATW